MKPSPYRLASKRDDERESTEPSPDRELIPIIVVVWIVSVARVVVALAQRETFGQEPTLALFSVLLLPVLVKDALLRRMSHEKGTRR